MPPLPDEPMPSPITLRIFEAVSSPRLSDTVGVIWERPQSAPFLIAIWRSRALSWSLFARGFTARMRQSVLGYLWSIIPPLVMALIFTVLARGRVLNLQDTPLPYPVFALIGLTVWWLFAGIVQSTTASLAQSANLIGKVQFPREALLISALGQPLFESIVRAVLVLVVGLILGVRWPPSVLLIPLATLPLALGALGLGAILAILNALVRDIQGMLNVLLPMLMFLTPVLYTAPRDFPYALINILNPVSPYVIMVQDLSTFTTPRYGFTYAVVSLLMVGLFLLGGRVFHLAQPVIAERI